MTSYVAIPNGDTDQDSPITQPLMTALRDNPIAIAEGDDPAPRILGEAAGRDSSVAARRLPVVTVAAGAVLSFQGQGRVDGTTSTTSTTNVVAYTFTIRSYSGSLRFSVVQQFIAGGTVTAEIYKNNVLVQAYTISNGSATRTNDVTVAVGDIIEWRHRASAGTSQLNSAFVSADDPYVTQDFYRRNSNA